MLRFSFDFRKVSESKIKDFGKITIIFELFKTSQNFILADAIILATTSSAT